jgi:hypothetical protein
MRWRMRLSSGSDSPSKHDFRRYFASWFVFLGGFSVASTAIVKACEAIEEMPMLATEGVEALATAESATGERGFIVRNVPRS